jgi:hypothetical protein
MKVDNAEMRLEGNRLIIEIDLDKRLGRSQSGATELIANTHGPRRIPGADRSLRINLTVFAKDGGEPSKKDDWSF